MFRQLFTTLMHGEALDNAFSEFSEMLDHAQWMFIRANDVLRQKASAEEVRDAIYRRDQAVNELLRGIRRKIVRHLSVNAGTDVAASLALMSIAKDAERIGDYCKNVFEVGQLYHEEFHVAKYHEPLEAVRTDVEALFTDVATAFRQSKKGAAERAIESAGSIRSRCDEIIAQLLGDTSDMETHEAVAYSLLARHYKRVAAHLANICTAVSGRIEDLDFVR